jgi:hypothetical protein
MSDHAKSGALSYQPLIRPIYNASGDHGNYTVSGSAWGTKKAGRSDNDWDIGIRFKVSTIPGTDFRLRAINTYSTKEISEPRTSHPSHPDISIPYRNKKVSSARLSTVMNTIQASTMWLHMQNIRAQIGGPAPK